MTENDTQEPEQPKRRWSIRLLTVFGLLLSCYLLLPVFGLRLTRVSKAPVPVAGTELERSRLQPPVAHASGTLPKNVVLVVADGFGFAHLAAARAGLHGMGARDTVWDRFTTRGWHRTHSATGFLVDSAAAATALATGVPTHSGWVGVGVDRTVLGNWFETAAERGYRSAIVTDSYVWDATPAAFVAHTENRDNADAILRQLAGSSLDVLAGEVEDLGQDAVPDWERTVQILEQRFQLFGPGEEEVRSFLADRQGDTPVALLLSEDQVGDLKSMPNLPAMVTATLDRLAVDERPFVLLVESEEPDSASHVADFPRLMRGLEALEATLDVVLQFAATQGETLVLFTADHETGGLVLSGTSSGMRALWSTPSHSGAVVPLLAVGPGAERFGGSFATWEVGRLLAGSLAPAAGESTPHEPALAAGS